MCSKHVEAWNKLIVKQKFCSSIWLITEIKKKDVCYPGWIVPIKRIISTSRCIHTVVSKDDGPRYARNMYRLTKYTTIKLYIKLVFLHMIISRCTVNKTWNVKNYVKLETLTCFSAGTSPSENPQKGSNKYYCIYLYMCSFFPWNIFHITLLKSIIFLKV